MGGKRKKCRKKRVGSVVAIPDNLGSNKEAGGGAQGAQGSCKICTSRDSVSPLSRLVRDFRNKYPGSPLGRINASGDDRIGLRGYVQFNKYTYIHTCIHTYIHIYIIHTYNIHTKIHTYILIHTHMHTYIHTCIHTYNSPALHHRPSCSKL